MKVSRVFKYVGIFVVLVAGAYLVGKFSSTEAVPPDFNEARSQGAVISESIVVNSNSLTADLNKIPELEREFKTEEALDLANKLIARSDEVKKQAQQLSDQLEKMTGALSDIKDDQARGLALESITDRLALISRLISYSDYLSQLLGNIRSQIAGLPQTSNNQVLIDQINAEVTAINNFNRQAAEAMDKFDKMVK
jgi:hypothetical protein